MLRAMRAVPVALLVLAFAMVLVALRWQNGARPSAADAPATKLEKLVRPVLAAATPKPRVARTVYLNREGARLTAGVDDATRNASSIVKNAGLDHADIPAFRGTAARWDAIAACVREKFAPFDVDVVETRPVEGDYVMAVFGGTPKTLTAALANDGHDHSHAQTKATGLAPYAATPVERAVVLVFTGAMREQLRPVCETAGMEIAHAYGLDHARLCSDLMTYLPACGPRRFVDKAVPCGEDKERPCGDGAPTQNSYARLLQVLGPRTPTSAAAR